MGMTIAQNLLLAVYPFAISLEALKQDLEALKASGFLVHEALATWNFAQVCSNTFDEQCLLLMAFLLTNHPPQECHSEAEPSRLHRSNSSESGIQ